LHNKKIGIVDVELYGLEEVLNCLLLRSVPIDEIFAGSSEHNLPRHTDLCIFLESNGRLLLVTVVEDDRYAGFGDSCLPTLIDKILKSQYQHCAP
jgi:hypothetical protein